jgi:hypothetical protein
MLITNILFFKFLFEFYLIEFNQARRTVDRKLHKLREWNTGLADQRPDLEPRAVRGRGEVRGSQVNKLIEVTVVNRVNSAHTWLLLRNIFIISWSKWSGIEIRIYGRADPLRWPRDTLHPQKLALTSPTSGSRSVGIVRSRTKATEIVLFSSNGKFSSSKIWSSFYFCILDH